MGQPRLGRMENTDIRMTNNHPSAVELDLCETISHLINLLPGKASATCSADFQLALTLKLDAATLARLEPVLAPATGYRPPSPGPEVTATPSQNFHVLIVEDTLVAQIMLRRTLEKIPGCRVSEATSGREALAMLRSGAIPDLCISDVSMPDMDGLELLREIRATPTLSKLDVMLCTASTDRETVLKAAELNVCRYLLKPYDPAVIQQQVRETLIRSARQQHQKLTDLMGRLGLDAEATIETLRGLSKQVAKDISVIRGCMMEGKHHAASLTLQGLRGSGTSVNDQALLKRIDTVQHEINQGELSGTLDALELLGAEGKRIAHVADRFAFVWSNQAQIL